MKIRFDISSVVLLAVGSLCFTNDAHAYLDPGTGSMIAQILLAGFAGLSVGARMYFRSIVSRLRSRRATH